MGGLGVGNLTMSLGPHQLEDTTLWFCGDRKRASQRSPAMLGSVPP